MKIGVLKETFPGEARVALTPASALQQQKLGHECFVEAGAGVAAQFSDADYIAAGVTVCATAGELIGAVDVIATKVVSLFHLLPHDVCQHHRHRSRHARVAKD